MHLKVIFLFIGDVYLQQMWGFISPELLKAVKEEPEEEVVPEMMDSFAKVNQAHCQFLLFLHYVCGMCIVNSQRQENTKNPCREVGRLLIGQMRWPP